MGGKSSLCIGPKGFHDLRSTLCVTESGFELLHSLETMHLGTIK